MKKNIYALAAAIGVGIIYQGTNNVAHTNTSQSPAGRSGGQVESGATCASSTCHGGSLTNDNFSISISSDVPASGFVPGNSYNVSVTMTSAGPNFVKGGFQASVQANGQHQGTVAATQSGTTVVGGSYISHQGSSAGTVISGQTRTWTFQWTAPTNAPSSVTVYAAGNFTNANSGSSGDVIKTANLEIFQQASSVYDLGMQKTIQVYPNPANDQIYIDGLLPEDSNEITVFNLNGNKVLQVSKNELFNNCLTINNIPSGIYFLHAGNTFVKFVKQ